jgi:membrane protein DedA with SNARE-associated domain
MAGMSGMHYPTFLRWNAAGGILWGTGCVLLGYAFSSALATVSRYLTWAPFALIAVVIGLAIVLRARRRRKEAVREGAISSD